MAELIDRSKLMFLLERELDMNGITDWGKGYMEAIHDAMEHAKFMETTTEAEIRASAIDEFAELILSKLDVDGRDWYCARKINEVAEELKEG